MHNHFISPIHTEQLVASKLTIHTVRQIAEILTCEIFPAKTCLEHVGVCMITMVLSVEEETVIVHCCYCTCGATS